MGSFHLPGFVETAGSHLDGASAPPGVNPVHGLHQFGIFQVRSVKHIKLPVAVRCYFRQENSGLFVEAIFFVDLFKPPECILYEGGGVGTCLGQLQHNAAMVLDFFFFENVSADEYLE